MSNTMDNGGPHPTFGGARFLGGGGGDPGFPFKGIVRNLGTAQVPVWRAGIYYDSSIYETRELDSDLDLTGLLSSANPGPADPGWRLTQIGDQVGVEVEIDDDGNPGDAYVKSLAVDKRFGNTVEYTTTGSGTDDDPTVYKPVFTRRVCFTVEADPKTPGGLIAAQCIRSDLFLESGVCQAYDDTDSSPHTLFALLLVQD